MDLARLSRSLKGIEKPVSVITLYIMIKCFSLLLPYENGRILRVHIRFFEYGRMGRLQGRGHCTFMW